MQREDRHRLDVGGGVACIDVDECSSENSGGNETLCDSEREFCWNTYGSYECICLQGFQRVGEKCIDIDQCKIGINGEPPCPDDRVCMNTDGFPGYECLCPDGYEDEFVVKKYKGPIQLSQSFTHEKYVLCHDIDECTLGLDECSAKRVCENTGKDFCLDFFFVISNENLNTEGSYECLCNTGYEKAGLDCLDIDECAQSPCDPGYACKNTDGSYICLCGEGYYFNMDYRQCLDLDECETRTHSCKETEQCVDTLGSYHCRCALGYTDNGLNTCVDDNECYSGVNLVLIVDGFTCPI